MSLAEVEPSVEFVAGDEPSTGESTVSVSVDETYLVVVYTAQSDSGICFYIRDDISEPASSGRGFARRVTQASSPCAASNTSDLSFGKNVSASSAPVPIADLTSRTSPTTSTTTESPSELEAWWEQHSEVLEHFADVEQRFYEDLTTAIRDGNQVDEICYAASDSVGGDPFTPAMQQAIYGAPVVAREPLRAWNNAFFNTLIACIDYDASALVDGLTQAEGLRQTVVEALVNESAF